MSIRLHPRDETSYQIAQNAAAKAAIVAAWTAHGGAPSAVATALGVSRSTLYREIRRLWGTDGTGEIPADLARLASVA